MQAITNCTNAHIDNQYRMFFNFGVIPFWNRTRKTLELHKKPLGEALGLTPISREHLKKAAGKHYGAGEEAIWWEGYHSMKWKPSKPRAVHDATAWWAYYHGDDEAQQDMQPAVYWEWTRWSRAGRTVPKAIECFDDEWRVLDDIALKKDSVKGFKKINGRWVEDPQRVAERARLYAKAEYAEAMMLWREYAQRMDTSDLYEKLQEAEDEYNKTRYANDRHRLAIRMAIIDSLIVEMLQPSDEWFMGVDIHKED